MNVIWVPALVFLTALRCLAADHDSSLQSEMDSVLKADPRNKGVDVSVRSGSGGSILQYDLKAIEPTNSIADVFRVFLQFARTEKSRTFTSVELAFRGQTRFRLKGEYFKKLGDEFGSQNPVYTMRTFPENVLRPDGAHAYPTWTGGLLGIAAKQTDEFNDFHRQWYLNDVIAITPARGGVAPTVASGLPEVAFSPVTQQPPNAEPPKQAVPDTPQPSAIPDWLSHFPQAIDQTGSGSPFSKYTTSAPESEVLTYYQDLLRQSNITFRASSNGVGTTLLAASSSPCGLETRFGCACVIRIIEGDGGTNVSVRCARQIGEPRAEFGPNQDAAPTPTLPPGVHRIDYAINGSAGKAGLTYKNASGGTEQNDINLPASLSFHATSGTFVYVAAQNKSREGNVHVAITVDGRLLQEATSSTPYGIATASGSVPR